MKNTLLEIVLDFFKRLKKMREGFLVSTPAINTSKTTDDEIKELELETVKCFRKKFMLKLLYTDMAEENALWSIVDNPGLLKGIIEFKIEDEDLIYEVNTWKEASNQEFRKDIASEVLYLSNEKFRKHLRFLYECASNDNFDYPVFINLKYINVTVNDVEMLYRIYKWVNLK